MEVMVIRTLRDIGFGPEKIKSGAVGVVYDLSSGENALEFRRSDTEGVPSGSPVRYDWPPQMEDGEDCWLANREYEIMFIVERGTRCISLERNQVVVTNATE